MKHNFSEWSKELGHEFCTRFESELSDLDRAITDALEPTPRALRGTRLGHRVLPDSRYRMALVALQRAIVCRDLHRDDDCDALFAVLKVVLKGPLPIQHDDLRRLLELLAAWPTIDPRITPVDEVVAQIERTVAGEPAPAEFQPLLEKIRQAVDTFAETKTRSIETLLARITNLCNDSVASRLKADQGWADRLQQELAVLSDSDRRLWERLLSHASSVSPAPPAKSWEVTLDEHPFSDDMEAYWREHDRRFFARRAASEWKETIDKHIAAVGASSFEARRLKWLQAVPDSKPGTLSQFSVNREVLRGLLWTCEHSDDAELTRAIRIATEYLYRKNSPLGATGVRVLAHVRSSNAQEELAHLLNQIKSQSHVRLVESARTLVAVRTGAPPIDGDDLFLPESSFSEIGRRVDVFSGFRAELTVTPSGSVELRWFKPNGQPQKSIPAIVKRDHASEVRNLQAAVKDVKSTLAKALDRLERAPLERRSWTADDWRTRYFDHRVVGTLGRRVLWTIEQNDETTIAAFDGRSLVDLGERKQELSPAARVSVWHPIESRADEVLAWREWLFARQIRQPFKQAHREIYLLTDAERRTQVYSNRFAAHILRQSQFRALAKTRGWQADYLGPWDGGDGGIAVRKLPAWNLRVEFWVSAAGDDDGHAGALSYIATDQVRFYRADSSEPMPLADVPQIPFSEIMRDVDLFVGVCSVGNDPAWRDGGLDGRHADYWRRYSFGELAETAVTRRAVLERIIPRLTIADRCTLSDRFLIVRGDLRTYRIHLGSSNILMEPDDQYLCIVPAKEPQADLFLPFEGDSRLSVILSKAFLLADDTSITDRTITRQIRGSPAHAD